MGDEIINKGKKSERLVMRLTIENKERISNIARANGVTMAEIVTRLIENLPLIDRKEKRERFAAINGLSREINYIGKNINQITIALRQIRADKKIEDGEFKLIEDELIKYDDKRNEIKPYS